MRVSLAMPMLRTCLTVRVALASWLLLLVLGRSASAALRPDQILLITNKNSPDSGKLVAQYAHARNVPAENIVALDLPDAEEIAFDDYERNVFLPLREFLASHHLDGKITCLLTFYGVPFRIANRINSTSDTTELADIQAQEHATAEKAAGELADLEKFSQSLDKNFHPGVGNELDAMRRRTDAAMGIAAKAIAGLADGDQRNLQGTKLIEYLRTLSGDWQVFQRVKSPPQNMDETQSQAWQARAKTLATAMETVQKLELRRFDPAARKELRKIVSETFGLLPTLDLLQYQAKYFDTADTGAATDSELALLYWNSYPRNKWQANALHFAFSGNTPPVMMTMRLDGPTPDVVKRIIQESSDIEATGLDGTVALDARGLAPKDAKGNINLFGQYDQHIRNLAQLLSAKTHLKVILANKEPVFAPHTVKNVAVYCGWYSVGHYVPGCDFVRGSVGFHVASFEMVTLRGKGAQGWVAGLLNDGVDATLGPVAEPYLNAFPLPDEFFPLLFTGKLPLAEVYWKTTPMTSWMISFLGDPLYTPYGKHPAMAVEDLPAKLRSALVESAVIHQ